MKNVKNLFCNMMLCLLLAGCAKEDVLIAPNEEIEWLKVEDVPNDPVGHAIYQIYKNTGIPVFYNDTIGHTSRVDIWGHSYTYYERLHLDYSLGAISAQGANSPSISSYTLCKKENVLGVVNFLNDQILPVLPKSVHVPSFLLLEDLQSNVFGSYAFKGLNTVAIAQASKIPTMDVSTLKKYKGAVFRAILTPLVLDKKYADSISKFYAVSRAYCPSKDIYSSGGIPFWEFSSRIIGYPAGYNITFQDMGFLGSDPANMYYTPMVDWIDVSMFLEAIMGNTSTEFSQTYGQYPGIMKKYALMKNILKDIGFLNL